MELSLVRRGSADSPALDKKTVGNALVVHLAEGMTGEAQALALGVAADAEHDLVVVDLPVDSPISMWESVAKALPRRRRGVRLVIGGRSRETTALAGQWLAERINRTVLAPDGSVIPSAGGALFVHSGRGSGWVRFQPGRPPAWEAKRFPRPAWDSGITAELTSTSSRGVAEPLPGGLWIRPVGFDGPQRQHRRALIAGMPAQHDTMTIVLGCPGCPPLTLDDAARLWVRLPENVRAKARFVQYGPMSLPAGSTVGQALADLLGKPVAFYSGLPVGSPHTPTLQTVLFDGRLGWRPFADELGYQPRESAAAATPLPELLAHHAPIDGLDELAPAVYWYAPDAVIEVVQSGLLVRPPQDGPDTAAVRGVTLDAAVHNLTFDAPDQASAPRMRMLAEDLLGRLDEYTRRMSRVLPAAALLAERARPQITTRALAEIEPAPAAPGAASGGAAPSAPGEAAAVLTGPSDGGTPAEPYRPATPVPGYQPAAPAALGIATPAEIPGAVATPAEAPGAVTTPAEVPSAVATAAEAPGASAATAAEAPGAASAGHPGPAGPPGTARPADTPGGTPPAAGPGPVAPPEVPGGPTSTTGHPGPAPVAGHPGSPTSATGHPGSPTSATGHPGSPAPTIGHLGGPAPTTDHPGGSAPTTAHLDGPAAVTGHRGGPTSTTGHPGGPAPATGRPGGPAPVAGHSDGPKPATGTGPESTLTQRLDPGLAVPPAPTSVNVPITITSARPPTVAGPATPAGPPTVAGPPAAAGPATSAGASTATGPAEAVGPPPTRTAPAAPDAGAAPEPAAAPQPEAKTPVVKASAALLFQPTPSAEATALLPKRGVNKEREWLRKSLGAEYGLMSNTAARILSEHPGFQGVLSTSSEEVLTDAVAVQLYLSVKGAAIDGGLRRGVNGPHVPIARCVVAGLSRLPSHRGPSTFAAALPSSAWPLLEAQKVLTEWGFLNTLTQPASVVADETDVLVWSITGRRTKLLEPVDAGVANRVLFVPGTSFKVLEARKPDGAARGVVLLRELTASEIDEHGRVATDRVSLDELAMTSLRRTLETWAEAGEDLARTVVDEQAAERFGALPGLV
ncbi:hypothetical protein [Amycolatopsis ultiminotia]